MANPKWEVEAAAVAAARKYDDLEVLDIYEAIGDRCNYWRPVQTITERLTALSDATSSTDRFRAVAILEKLLSTPGQSATQQKRLKAAIVELRARDLH